MAPSLFGPGFTPGNAYTLFENPPNVIPVDVGRLLLVDDFLIEENTLRWRFHTPKFHEDNPVLEPHGLQAKSAIGAPYASLFRDGTWCYDMPNRSRSDVCREAVTSTTSHRAFSPLMPSPMTE